MGGSTRGASCRGGIGAGSRGTSGGREEKEAKSGTANKPSEKNLVLLCFSTTI
jgi:hypothetical protein